MKLSLSLCLVPAVTPHCALPSLWVRMALPPSLLPSLTNNVKPEPETGPPVPYI